MITIFPAIAARLVLQRAPQHRPIAVALWIAGAVEIARPHLPSRPALACMLALPALSAWATLRALIRARAGAPAIAVWLVAAALVLLLPKPSMWWAWAWPVGFGAGVAVEVIAGVLWWRRGRLLTVTQETAIVLAGGDVGALVARAAFGVEAWRWWSVAVAVVATWLQVRFLLRPTGGGRVPISQPSIRTSASPRRS